MFCTRCGIELAADARFCSQCAEPTAPVKEERANAPSSLSLPREGKKILGVCAGFARYLGVDVTLVRIIWLTTALFAGTGFLAYLVAWIIMPKDPDPVVRSEFVRQSG